MVGLPCDQHTKPACAYSTVVTLLILLIRNCVAAYYCGRFVRPRGPMVAASQRVSIRPRGPRFDSSEWQAIDWSFQYGQIVSTSLRLWVLSPGFICISIRYSSGEHDVVSLKFSRI